MKYICNICGYTGEGDIQYCPMCGSTNLKIENGATEDNTKEKDNNVYPCTIAREFTQNSVLVQFANQSWGILDFDTEVPSDMIIGKKVNVTIENYDQQGYPRVRLFIEKDPANSDEDLEKVVQADNHGELDFSLEKEVNKEESKPEKREKKEKKERVQKYTDDDFVKEEEELVPSEMLNQISSVNTYEVASDVAKTLFESEDNQPITQGRSWEHWHEIAIGHQSAGRAVYSLESFINNYIETMYKKREAVSESKEKLRAGFESQKQSIKNEYEKTMKDSHSISSSRIQGNRERGASIDKVIAGGQYYLEGIPNDFRAAKKAGSRILDTVATTAKIGKTRLKEQLDILQQIAQLDGAIITEKFNEKLNDAQIEYDRNYTNIEMEFETFSSSFRQQCSENIAGGFSKTDIASYSRVIDSSKLNENNYESPKRLPEYINLGTMCLDIDASVDTDHINIAHIVEQQTQDIIKKNGDIFTIELPYCQRLLDGISLFVSYDEQDRMMLRDRIQPLLLKLFMYFPAGLLEATMIDPLEMGTSFQGIPKLAGITNERIIDTKIWSKESDIEQAIATLRLRMETLNQSYNGDRVSRFQKEPVKVLAITDFPVGFTNSALKDLQAIVRNGATLGVCVLIWANNKELAKFRERNESLYQEIVSNLIITHAEGEKLRFENSQVYLKLDDMNDIKQNNDQIINIIKNNIEHCTSKIERFEDMMRYDIEDSNNWFTGNDHEISVPIGIKGADTVVNMVLGRGGGSTEHHVLIAGQTGAGKTTLMHTLIMSTLIQYSPEDVQMYLVDFKEGVAFKPYTKFRLPSLRVVAIDSEREFGLSILNELCSELENRADIFSREEVEDINDYNDIQGLKKIPKILLIFDEVQELFRSRGSEDSISKGCLSAIGKLVTQGRALGIHLILACQDFAHCQGLQAYFSQMAVRIAVKGSEESAASILNSDNQGVRTLQNQPAGSAIYNRAGGVESANTFFQVAYMTKEERINLLHKLNEYYTDSVISEKYKNCNTRVMLTNAEDNINNRFNQLIRYGFYEDLEKIGKTETALGIQVGQGFGRNFEFTIDIERERGNNLLVMGKDEKKAMSIFEFSAMSLLYDELFINNDASSTLLYIADMSEMEELRDDICSLVYLQEILPDQISVVKIKQLERLIDTIYRKVVERKESRTMDKQPVFFMIFGIDRAKNITINRMYDDEEQSISTIDKLLSIFKYGPEVGIHSIVWGENPLFVKRILGERYVGFFDLRVAFGLSAEDMYDIASEGNIGNMNDSTAAYINVASDIKNKHFRPYTIPAKVWLDDFADVYMETIEEE